MDQKQLLRYYAPVIYLESLSNEEYLYLFLWCHYREKRKREKIMKAYKDTEVAFENYKKEVESRKRYQKRKKFWEKKFKKTKN